MSHTIDNRRFSFRTVALAGAIASIAVAAWAGGQPPAGGGGDKPDGQPPAGTPGGGRGQPGGRPGREGQGPNVEGAMRALNGSIRQLKGQITDAGKKDENLRIIGAAQRAAVQAKLAPLPAKLVEGKDDAAKAKLADGLRADLIAAVRKMLDIEEDIAAGKTADAAKKLDELVKLRDQAHEKVGVKLEE